MRNARFGVIVAVGVLVGLLSGPAHAQPVGGESGKWLPDPGWVAALDSLAAQSGVRRQDLRVDPAAIEFEGLGERGFPLHRYLLREPERVAETAAALGAALTRGDGLGTSMTERLLTVLATRRPALWPGARAEEPAPELTSPSPIDEAMELIYAGTGKRYQGKERDKLLREVTDMSLPEQTQVARLIVAVVDAARERNRILESSQLPQGGIFGGKSKRAAKAVRDHLANQAAGRPATADAAQAKDEWESMVASVDLDALYRTSVALSRELDTATERLRRSMENLGEESWRHEWPTPWGRVAVGGRGAQRYHGEYLLVVDFGGDDVYEGPGSVSGGLGVSLVMDLAGNDSYAPADSGQAGPGGAILGFAGVRDAGNGNDVYHATAWGLGFGFLGVGWLHDEGGDDVYRAQWLSQGAGVYGLGLLLDERGNDEYGSTVTEPAFDWGRVQGYGGSEGMGLLVDLAGGDRYRLKSGPDGQRAAAPSQGAAGGGAPGRSGGWGVLLDAGGDDQYETPHGGQGAGEDRGLGLLIDIAGNDEYRVRDAGQGSGRRLGLGVLYDCGGTDSYTAFNSAQGMGEDLGMGVLMDTVGNDSYRASYQSLGASVNRGVGWCLDLDGTDALALDGHGDTLMGWVGSEPAAPWRAGVRGVAVFVDLGRTATTAAGFERFPVRGDANGMGGVFRRPPLALRDAEAGVESPR